MDLKYILAYIDNKHWNKFEIKNYLKHKYSNPNLEYREWNIIKDFIIQFMIRMHTFLMTHVLLPYFFLY